MNIRAESSDVPLYLPPLSEDDPDTEIYRHLYASLDLSPEDDQVIGIVSSISGEGTTTIALGLARTLAHDLNVAVALVEVNFARPCLEQRLGLPTSPGLAAVLNGKRWIGDVLIPAAENLHVVTAGAPEANTASLLHQIATSTPLFAEQGLPCVVVMDLPPILDHGYSRLTTRLTDALLLVVRAGVTPIHLVQKAVAMLDAPPRGVVFNEAPRSGRAWRPKVPRKQPVQGTE